MDREEEWWALNHSSFGAFTETNNHADQPFVESPFRSQPGLNADQVQTREYDSNSIPPRARRAHRLERKRNSERYRRDRLKDLYRNLLKTLLRVDDPFRSEFRGRVERKHIAVTGEMFEASRFDEHESTFYEAWYSAFSHQEILDSTISALERLHEGCKAKDRMEMELNTEHARSETHSISRLSCGNSSSQQPEQHFMVSPTQQQPERTAVLAQILQQRGEAMISSPETNHQLPPEFINPSQRRWLDSGTRLQPEYSQNDRRLPRLTTAQDTECKLQLSLMTALPQELRFQETTLQSGELPPPTFLPMREPITSGNLGQNPSQFPEFSESAILSHQLFWQPLANGNNRSGLDVLTIDDVLDKKNRLLDSSLSGRVRSFCTSGEDDCEMMRFGNKKHRTTL